MKNKEMLWKNNGILIHPSVKVVGQVYIADYDRLEQAEGQRSLTAGGLKCVGESVLKNGVCSAPIVVRCPERKNMYIVVDGGHRVYIAEKNNLPIICTLVEPECTINELMIILNTTQSNWSAEAYLNNGVVFHRNPEYVFLREVYEDTEISLTALYHIYAYDLGSIPRAKKVFESGDWMASTKSLGNKVIKYSEELAEFMPFSHKARFLQGFVKAVSKKGYSQKHMIAQAKRFPNHVHSFDTPSEHNAMLNKLYNHCCEEETQTYLS